MFGIQIRQSQGHRIRLPKGTQGDKIITLAQRFVQQEATLPPNERTPITPYIELALAEAQATQAQVEQAEDSRKESSEALKRVEDEAIELIGQARSQLAAHFHAQPERAQGWGLWMRQTGPGRGYLRLPIGREERLRFFNRYIAKEESRPEAERFTEPPLGEMQAIRDALQTHWQGRDANYAKRLQQHVNVKAHCATLLDLLRLGLMYLVLIPFERTVTLDLLDWGFAVAVGDSNGRSATPDSDDDETAVSADDLLAINPFTEPAFTTSDPDTGVTLADLTAPPTTP